MKEYRFEVTDYDPALSTEIELALRAETERKSRDVLPKMWAVTDKMNRIQKESGGASRPKTSSYLLSVCFIGAGILLFYAGLRQPAKFNILTVFGALVLFWGIVRLIPKGTKRQDRKFKNGANALLNNLNNIDPALQPKVTISDSGVCISSGTDEKNMDFDSITAAYETQNLWIFAYGNAVTVVQKADLLDAEPGEVSKYLRKRIKNRFEILDN